MVNLLNWTEARKFQTFKAIKMARTGNVPPTCDLAILPIMGGYSHMNFKLPRYSWNPIPNCGLLNENNEPTYYTGRKKYEQRQLSWFQYLSLRFLHNIAPWPPNETEWWTVTRQRPDLTYLSNGTWHHYPLCSSPGIIFSDLVDDGFSWYPVGGNAWNRKFIKCSVKDKTQRITSIESGKLHTDGKLTFLLSSKGPKFKDTVERP